MITSRDPIRARAVMSNGKEISIDPSELPSLYDALDSRDFWRGPLDVDEGSWIDPRSLERIGGRSEFERARQRRLMLWLRNYETHSAPKAMIIGDSIRMRISNGTGYLQYAYRALVGKVNMTHIPHNCGGTVTGVNLMGNWVSVKPDLVHYNAGLHDLATFKNSDSLPSKYTSIQTYKENLVRIFETVLGMGVRKIIWALSTPVDDEWHARRSKETGARQLIRRDVDVQAYNAASLEVANDFGIEVNDLYTPLREAGVRTVVLPDGVHLNYRGSELAGGLVAKTIIRCF